MADPLSAWGSPPSRSRGHLSAPSALIVMLAAINAHRAGYGVALVIPLSVGLAGLTEGPGAQAVASGEGF